jgi:hypothetical protein
MKKTLMFVLVLTFGISLMGISTAIAGGMCCPKGEGTGTPGYWKNHPEVWEDVILYLSCGQAPPQAFDQSAVLEILDAPVKNDKWITLFKAWAAAVLNVEVNGNCPPVCPYPGGADTTLGTVNYWLCSNLPDRPINGNDDEWQYSHGEAQYECLDDYNNGYLRDIAISRDELE